MLPAETARRAIESDPRRSAPGPWIAALAVYWAALFIATHVPTPQAVRSVLQLDFDKLVHAGAYALLATLVLVAWRSRGGSLRWPWRLALAGGLVLYGAFDELTQPLVGRVCDPIDWAADTAGVSLAACVDLLRRPEVASRSAGGGALEEGAAQ